MRRCPPAHADPVRFHRKSTPPGCNTPSICGPRMGPNSHTLFRCACGEEERGERVKGERVCGCSWQAQKACKSCFPRLGAGGGDDCALFQMMTIMGPGSSFTVGPFFSRRLTAARHGRRPRCFRGPQMEVHKRGVLYSLVDVTS